jgi:anti-sigma B factor antagonist
MALRIETRKSGEILIVDIHGRLWVQEPSLAEQVHTWLAEGHRFFVFNLAGVNYLDSSGLGQLVSIWTSIRSKGGNINLLRPTEKVRSLLRRVSLHIVFDVFDDEERAVIAAHRDWPK